MNKIILAVISIAVIIFVFSAGIFYQAQKDSQLATKAGITETLAKNLNSKNVTISTRGFVKSISGRTLSIFEGSYNLTIPIRQDAKIYDLGPNSSGVKNSEFSAIKLGNYVNISIILNDKGDMEGASVFLSTPPKQ